MPRRGFWSKSLPWLGAVAGIALLGWVLRNLDVSRFLDVLAEAELWPLAVLLFFILADSVVRAEKWRHMLTPLAAVARMRLFGAIMAGYFANMVTPVRVSPLVRAWLVARLENVPTMSLLATIALDRTIDGLVFTGFVVLALATLRFPVSGETVREGLIWGALSSSILLIVLVALLIALRRGLMARVAGVVSRLPLGWMPARWREIAARFAYQFVDGVVWPNERWRGAVIVAASVLLKLMALGHYFWAGLAFGVVLAPEAYLYLMVFLGFLAILAGSLRIVGGFTAGSIYALGTLGVDAEAALAMTLTVQAITNLTVAIAGAVALWAQGVGLGALRRMPREDPVVDSPRA